ncbi:PadR family transcriptional regulator [Peribacillus butanolivorans]|uniref:PadR family transcriptional regulator n=1 Tax=Peribacillus butanolivorans TaxID=421767 RepID=UPI00366954FD
MEDKLNKLNRAMKRTVFADVKFTDKQKTAIKQRLVQAKESDEEVMIAIFRILQEEQSGYQIMSSLIRRGIEKFTEQEGILYTMLHDLEQRGFIEAKWEQTEKKSYCLSNKGRRMLAKSESKQNAGSYILQTVLEG